MDFGFGIRQFFYKLYNNDDFCRCLARAIIVFFIVYGCIQSFLSCFDITMYNWIAFAVCGAVFSIYFGFMFYSEKNKNLMYLILLMFFLLMTFFVGRYSNSGFYAIINIIYKKLEVEMDLTGIVEYTERYANRYYTITAALVFIFFGLGVFVNAVVSNSMNFFVLFFATALLVLFPLYLGYTPNPVYAWMLSTGYVSVYVLGRSGSFRYKSLLTRLRERHEARRGRIYVSKMSDGKMMFCVTAASALVTMAVLMVTGAIFGDFNFYTGEKWSNMKSTADEYVKDVVTYGFWGLGNDYDSAGGVSEGRLGGVSSVRPDYQTDLVVEYTPYSYEPVYLRAYVGGEYLGNRWYPAFNRNLNNDENYFDEVEALKKAYAYDIGKNSMGRMYITNVGADPRFNYLPYYADNEILYIDDTDHIDNTDENNTESASGTENTSVTEGINGTESTKSAGSTDISGSKGKKQQVMYYPYNPDAQTEYLEVPDPVFSQVPVKNTAVIRDFCKNAGILQNDDAEQITKKMKAYFQQNYPYTMRPGKTPVHEDYVNFFLQKQKKGLCMHYASAATLVYRYMGIPARYVEGYAFSYGDVLNGELVPDERYDDWYRGYSVMGETGVVKVEINDIHAHAWTEIFDNRLGWVPVDLTPTSIGLDENTDRDFWEIFNKWMGEGDNADTQAQEAEMSQNLQSKFSASLIGFGELVAVICLVLLAAGFSGRAWKFIKLKKSLKTGSKEDRLIKRYQYLCMLERKKNPQFDTCHSHSSQLEYFAKKYGAEYSSEIAEMLERISYGRGEKITDKEFEEACKLLDTLFKNSKKYRRKKVKLTGKNTEEKSEAKCIKPK